MRVVILPIWVIVMMWSSWQLGNKTVPNALVRAATYEGLADGNGFPTPKLSRLYAQLAESGIGMIITGFCYINSSGRAMQPRQCGIDSDDKIEPWRGIVNHTREANDQTILVMQIAHAGRQTVQRSSAVPVLAPTSKGSPYFRSAPVAMNSDQITETISDFIAAARRACKAGFDAVELHGAHGYLIHQFLSPDINDRRDRWGRDRLAFLREIITGIQADLGDQFPLIVKISAGDDCPSGVGPELAAKYAAELAQLGIAAIEVSYGTMDLALNIFRGGVPVNRALKYNPLFATRPPWQRLLWSVTEFPKLRRRLKPFTKNYNRAAARIIRSQTKIPLILVGGIRSAASINQMLEAGEIDAAAMCRPLIRDPGLARKFKQGESQRSSCTNCNRCAIMCDSDISLRCYGREKS